MRARFHTLPPWARLLCSLTLSALLLGALAYGALQLFIWLLLSRNALQDQPLDVARWRAQPPGASLEDNPRRHMARSAQRWIAGERPTRAQVEATLGPDEIGPSDGVTSYYVGCGFTSGVCMDEESLNVHYDAGGRAIRTDFWQF